MAEVILQVLVDNLNSFIKGELALISNFKKEFEKLSSTFSTIQAVLEDAQEKKLKDKAVENWLEKLNVAACQVDDILDECKTKTETFKQSGYGQYHPKVISFRRKIGKRMKEIMEKLDAIAEERRKFHLREMITVRQIATHETDSSRRNDNISIPICKCSKPARLLTSSTEKNPGRRYFTCQLRRSKGGCDFFRWYDGVFSPRAIEVINELMRESKIDKEQLRFSKIGLQRKREPFNFEAIPRSWKPMMLVALVAFLSFLVGKLR